MNEIPKDLGPAWWWSVSGTHEKKHFHDLELQNIVRTKATKLKIKFRLP